MLHETPPPERHCRCGDHCHRRDFHPRGDAKVVARDWVVYDSLRYTVSHMLVRRGEQRGKIFFGDLHYSLPAYAPIILLANAVSVSVSFCDLSFKSAIKGRSSSVANLFLLSR